MNAKLLNIEEFHTEFQSIVTLVSPAIPRTYHPIINSLIAGMWKLIEHAVAVVNEHKLRIIALEDENSKLREMLDEKAE